MKKFLIVPFVILCIGCSSTEPTVGPSESMMNEADTIVLTVEESADMAYQNFKAYLNDKGFEVSDEEGDKSSRMMKTDYKPLGNSSTLEFRINAEVQADSTTLIKIMGRGYSSISGNVKLETRDSSTSPVNAMWIRVVQLAKAYPHKSLYYGRNIGGINSPDPYQEF